MKLGTPIEMGEEEFYGEYIEVAKVEGGGSLVIFGATVEEVQHIARVVNEAHARGEVG